MRPQEFWVALLHIDVRISSSLNNMVPHQVKCQNEVENEASAGTSASALAVKKLFKILMQSLVDCCSGFFWTVRKNLRTKDSRFCQN